MVDIAEERLFEITRLRDALKPSVDTKAAYSGEFHFQHGSRSYTVPWDTLKEIMKAISARAALKEPTP